MSCKLVLMGRLARFQSNGVMGLEDESGVDHRGMVFRERLLSGKSIRRPLQPSGGGASVSLVGVVDGAVSGQRGRLRTRPLFRVKLEKGAIRGPKVRAWAVGRLNVPPRDTGKEDWVGKGEPWEAEGACCNTHPFVSLCSLSLLPISS